MGPLPLLRMPNFFGDRVETIPIDPWGTPLIPTVLALPSSRFAYENEKQRASSGIETPFEPNSLAYDGIPIALCLPSFRVTYHSHLVSRDHIPRTIPTASTKKLASRNEKSKTDLRRARFGQMVTTLNTWNWKCDGDLVHS
ncbi:unnamed protein product [Dovyalis caffra]|uniref:Uncharacterized protein n=1 Tax=Dovyalis caffra TaxID=77055 RepID=A0AAV1R8J1_9ROSI|nr:unnamed protein product [Dovyalis caffra]